MGEVIGSPIFIILPAMKKKGKGGVWAGGNVVPPDFGFQRFFLPDTPFLPIFTMEAT